MATNVIMPKQGLQMTEGTIIQWHKAEGDAVVEGEPLFEMETDKLTIDIDAPGSGTLLKIVTGPGETAPITATIAILGEPGEDISALLAEIGAGDATEAAQREAETPTATPTASTATPTPAPAPATATPIGAVERPTGGPLSSPRARRLAEREKIDLATVAGSGPDGLIIERDVAAAAAERPAVTPLARTVAEQRGIDPTTLTGTGPAGRVTRSDVLAAADGASAPTAHPSPIGTAATREDRITPLSNIRKTIARRMRESLDSAAQAVHRRAVDMSEVARLRERLKAAEVPVSYNDVVLKATAFALRRHPVINSALTDEGLIEFGRVNVGIAVAIDGALVVPVLKDADMRSLAEIRAESRRLAEAARGGTLTADEMSGGTFSVSNLGMYGVDSFTAIIDVPQTAILAVGAVKDRVVPVDGAPAIRPICELSLTYDHRVVDGAPAAEFLQTVTRVLENPYLLS